MRVYAICALALVLSVAYAQNHVCQPFDASGYTAHVCPSPTYQIDVTTVSTATADGAYSALSQLKSFNNATSFVSPRCITAYLNLMCAQAFPVCQNTQPNTVTLGPCSSVCTDLYTSCSNSEISAINSVASGNTRIPESSSACVTVYPSPSDACTNTADVMISITEVQQLCVVTSDSDPKRFYNETLSVSAYLYSNSSYFNGQIDKYKQYLQYLSGSPNPKSVGGPPPPVVNSTCMRAYLYFYNALVVPQCDTTQSQGYLPPCRPLCIDVLTGCQGFDVENVYAVPLPAANQALCASLFPNQDSNCYSPNAASVYTGFYLSDTTASPETPAPSVTPAPYIYRNTTKPREEEWSKGGILGGGLLLAIFAVMGGLMLLMKKQDSR